ncbi:DETOXIFICATION 45, chloroplastic-like protein [Tanacetum coccineum]
MEEPVYVVSTKMIDEGKVHAKTEDPYEDVRKLDKDGDKTMNEENERKIVKKIAHASKAIKSRFIEEPVYVVSTKMIDEGKFIVEAKRSLHDAIMIFRRAMKNSTVVAGGGAIHICIIDKPKPCVGVVANKVELITALAYIYDGLHYGVLDFEFAPCSMMLVGAMSLAFLLYAPLVFGLAGVVAGLTLFIGMRAISGFIRHA